MWAVCHMLDTPTVTNSLVPIYWILLQSNEFAFETVYLIVSVMCLVSFSYYILLAHPMYAVEIANNVSSYYMSCERCSLCAVSKKLNYS